MRVLKVTVMWVSIVAADIDGDGDIDVVGAASGANQVVWFQNDGSGGFSSRQVIAAGAGQPFSIEVADIDADGDLDVLAALFMGDEVALYENDGTQSDGTQSFIVHTVSSNPNPNSPIAVATGDLNNDGRLDVVAANAQTSSGFGSLWWYEHDDVVLTNTLNGNPTFTEDGMPVVLDTNVAVFDPELSAINGGGDDFGGTTLTIQRSGGANSDDVFSAGGTLSFGATDFFLNSARVGTFTNSAGTIELTFASGVTNIEVNRVMRSLRYSNSSDTPPASVDLTWTFDDSNDGSQGSGGALQANGITTVDIIAVNDAPTTTPITLVSIAEDSGARLITQAELLANATDVEGDALTATGLAIDTGGGSITNNGDGTWNYTPDPCGWNRNARYYTCQ